MPGCLASVPQTTPLPFAPLPPSLCSFLSHFQTNAGPQVMLLKQLLEDFSRSAGREARIWLDKDAENRSEEGMKAGVRQCRNFLFFLTDGVLTRWYCEVEIKEAIRWKKTIMLVEEKDTRVVPHWHWWEGQNKVGEDVPEGERGRPLQVAAPKFGDYMEP